MKHFARIALITVGLAVLGGCAQFQSFVDNVKTTYDAVTSAQVTPTSLAVVGNAFDAAQASGTAYLTYCKGSSDSVCSTTNKQTVIRAVYSGRVARNRLKRCVKAGACGAGGASDYALLKAATDSITSIVNLWKGS